MKRLILAVFLAASALSYAQTGATTVIRHSGTLPTTCSGGDIYIKSGSPDGFYYNIAPGSCSWLAPSGIGTASDVISLFSGCGTSGSKYLGDDGACHTAGGSPAGSNTQVQFNDSGAFGADPDFIWDKVNHLLAINRSTGGQGGWKLYDSGGTNYVLIQAPSSVTTYTLTPPDAASAGAIVMDSSGNESSANGTAGQVLTSNGAGSAPTFQAAAGGGSMTKLCTLTASSSASLDFTSANCGGSAPISSTYKKYVISIDNIVIGTSTGGYLLFQLSTNGGSTWDTTTSNYYSGTHFTRLDATNDAEAHCTTCAGVAVANNPGGSQPGASSTVQFFNSAASVYRTFTFSTVEIDNSGGYYSMPGAGVEKNTTQATALRIIHSSSTLASGTATIYGITE